MGVLHTRQFGIIILVLLTLIVFSQIVAAQGLRLFTPPHELLDDYCVTPSLLAEYDSDEEQYDYTKTDGICTSYLNPDLFGMDFVFLLPGNCSDGVQSLGEEGVDCGGDCDAQCVQCIDPWTTTYWPIGVPTKNSEQIGPRLFQLFDDEVLIRAYDTLFEFADNEGKSVSSLDTSDEVIESIAWYVDKHMSWKSDNTVNPQCINGTNNLGYDAGWDFPIPASYTIRYTGVPDCTSCGAQYCGDCEDHAILRHALAKKIGISSKCIWNAQDLQNPGRHEYNIVIYKGKYRLMDYGTIDTHLDTHKSNIRETNYSWNYVYGPRVPSIATVAKDFTYNYPLDGPLADAGKVDCPPSWSLNSYYKDTCP